MKDHDYCKILIYAAAITRILQAQPCPGKDSDFVCNDSIPTGAWVSNITYNPPRNDGDHVSFTWAPDLHKNDSDYSLFLRNLDSGTPEYMVSLPTRISMLLEPNTHYEALICHENVTTNLLTSGPEFFEECGFCQTCFHTMESSRSGNDTYEEDKANVHIPFFAVIVLISVSLFILIHIPIGLIFIALCRRCSQVIKGRKNKSQAEINDRELNSLNWSLQMNMSGSVKVGEQSILSTAYAHLLKEKFPEDMIIPPSAINVSSVIGQGEFGVIYKAYRNICTQQNINEMVAVKTLKGIFATESDIENATEEILKMRHFNHINVMPMLGVCLTTSNHTGPSLVMPYMERGSLLDYIRKEADNLVVVATTEDEVAAVRNNLIQMCMQISRGMQYLASLKFIHRDLAARNCLMDANGIIKVSDFGLTENVYSRNYYRQVKEGARLPLKWMALESIKLGVFTEKTDVWSFGVTCWEVLSGGAIPYAGTHPQEVLDYLEEGNRLSKPKNAACCSDVYDLLLSCWEQEEDLRPTFSKIVCTLEKYLTSVTGYMYVDLADIRTSNSVSDNDSPGEDDEMDDIEDQIGSIKNEPLKFNGYCIAGI